MPSWGAQGLVAGVRGAAPVTDRRAFDRIQCLRSSRFVRR